MDMSPGCGRPGDERALQLPQDVRPAGNSSPPYPRPHLPVSKCGWHRDLASLPVGPQDSAPDGLARPSSPACGSGSHRQPSRLRGGMGHICVVCRQQGMEAGSLRFLVPVLGHDGL